MAERQRAARPRSTATTDSVPHERKSTSFVIKNVGPDNWRGSPLGATMMITRSPRLYRFACATLLTLGLGCDPSLPAEWSAENLEWSSDDPCVGVEHIVVNDDAPQPLTPPTSADAKVLSCPDPDDPRVNYAYEDPEVCAGISIHCLSDWVRLPKHCGCGCMHDPDLPFDPAVCR